MIDHELEERFRAWFKSEVSEGETAPHSLRAALAEIPQGAGTDLARRRRTLVLLLALVAALLLAGAAAISSGLLRLPTDHNLDALVPIDGPCDPTVPDGVLLVSTALHETGPVTSVWLYEDGRLIREEPISPTDSSSRMDGIWSQRRLTQEGVALMLGAVEQADLPNCRSLNIPDLPQGGEVDVVAQTDRGVVSLSFASRPLDTRLTSPTEADAGRVLATHIADLDAWIPADEWLDTGWHPFVPERWTLVTDYPADSITRDATWQITLPDGSTMLTFGTHVPTPQNLSGVFRCGVVTAADAELIRSEIGASGTSYEHGWDWPLADGGSVSLRGLLPHEAGCEIFRAVPPVPGGTPDPAVAGITACAYLPELVGHGIAYPYNGNWLRCEWFSRPTLPGGWMYARGRTTSPGEAEELAGLLFGNGNFTTTQLSGATVFLNVCVSRPSECQPAVAISASPYFIVVVPDIGTEVLLRKLAGNIIEALPDQERVAR